MRYPLMVTVSGVGDFIVSRHGSTPFDARANLIDEIEMAPFWAPDGEGDPVVIRREAVIRIRIVQ